VSTVATRALIRHQAYIVSFPVLAQYNSAAELLVSQPAYYSATSSKYETDGVFLEGEQGQLRCRIDAWEAALHLSLMAGWTPAGQERFDSAGGLGEPLVSITESFRRCMAWGADGSSRSYGRMSREDAASLSQVLDRLATTPLGTRPDFVGETPWFSQIGEFARGGAFAVTYPRVLGSEISYHRLLRTRESESWWIQIQGH
jgi:hypothetical protein